MRIGIMGGAFDPIHIGHLIAAETVKEQMMLDEVWFVPSFLPPHKKGGTKATAAQRWDMLTACLADYRYFRAINVELIRGGTTYTVDTVMELKETYSDHEFYYILGADMMSSLEKWYKIDQLLAMISFVAIERGGYELKWEALPQKIQRKLTVVTMVHIGISSTIIRDKRKLGHSITFLVPHSIAQYIENQQLYT